MHFGHRFLDEVVGASAGVGLEVSAGTVPLDGIAPLRHAPGKLDVGFQCRFRQSNPHGVIAGRFDVANIDESGERR